MNFLWVLQHSLVGYSWFDPSWFNPPWSRCVILCCDSILTAVTIICWAHIFLDRFYYYLTNIFSVRYCVNSVVFIVNNTYSRKPHHKVRCGYKYVFEVTLCLIFFFLIIYHSFIWRSSPVYGFFVTCWEVHHSLRFKAVCMRVCTYFHVLLYVCGFMDKGCDWPPPQTW